MVVKLSGDRTQYSIVGKISHVVGNLLCSKMVILVRHQLLYFSFEPSVSYGQDVYIVVLKGMILKMGSRVLT